MSEPLYKFTFYVRATGSGVREIFFSFFFFFATHRSLKTARRIRRSMILVAADITDN